jgi:hypothetical protein
VDPRDAAGVLPLAKSLGVGTVYFKTFGVGKMEGETSGFNQSLKARTRGKVSSGGAGDTDATLPRLSLAEHLHDTRTLDPDVARPGAGYPPGTFATRAAGARVRLLVGPVDERAADEPARP